MEHFQTTEEDAPVVFMPHMYPDFYSNISDHGTVKPRRRRKRSKAETDASLARKRKLSAEQATQLEMSFVNEHKLESGRKDKLASELGLDPRQVAVWFQNRRARWKCKKMEEEYARLKIVHDSVLMESCRRESEIVKLKEQLTVAEKEIRRLAEGREVASSNNSSCSSLSMEAAQLLGMEALENIIFSPEGSCYVHQEMEWANLYM